MLFVSWQLKATICILFVTSCGGQELFRACERDYCYEMSGGRRLSAPNDPNEWHRYRHEHVEREEPTEINNQQRQRDNIGNRVNDNNERRVRQDSHHNNRLADQNRREKSEISDVTRHLVNGIAKHRILRQSEDRIDTSRERLNRLSYSDKERQSDNDREHKELLERLDERIAERDVRMDLEDNQEERSENSMQISKHYLNSGMNDFKNSKRINERRFLEREPSPRFMENIHEQVYRHKALERFDNRDASRRLDVSGGLQRNNEYRTINERNEREEYDNSKRQGELEDRQDANKLTRYNFEGKQNKLEQLGDYAVKVDVNRQSRRIVEGNIRKIRVSQQHRDEEGIKMRLEDRRKERYDMRISNHKAERSQSARSGSNHKERHYTLRRFDDRESRKISVRSDNDRERLEHNTASRVSNNQETHRTIVHNLKVEGSETQQKFRKRLENDREFELMQRRVANERERETLRNDYIEYQRDDDRKSESNRRAHHDDSIRLERDGRVVRESRIPELSDDNHDTLHTVERVPLKDYKLMRLHDNNEESNERYKTPRRLDDREIQNDFNRFSNPNLEEYELIQRGYGNDRNRQRHEDRQIEREDNRRLEENREERRNTLLRLNGFETQRSRNERKENLQRFDHHSDATERSINSRLIDEKLDQEEIVQHRLERSEDREARYDTDRFSDHEVFHDSSRRANNFRRERNQIMIRLDQREVNQRSDDTHKTQNLIGETFLRERESIQHRNENKPERVERYEGQRRNIRNTIRSVEDIREAVRNHNLFKQLSDNRRVDGKRESPNFIQPHDVPGKGYMGWAQGAILAYVILKALNGKNDLKNHLHTKLRESMEVMCF